MLRVLSLDGATVATLEGHDFQGRQVREAVESLSEARGEAFDLVYRGHLLCDGDVLSREGSEKILTASKDRIAIFDTRPPGQKLLSRGPFRQLIGASSSPDGSMWLVSMADGSVEIYEVETGEKICRVQGLDL
eukprot:s1075_g17.t1